MIKNFKNIISAVLCLTLSVSAFAVTSVTAAASGITDTKFSAPPSDDNSAAVKAFEAELNALPAPVIVDFSTAESLAENAKVFVDKARPKIGGDYTFINLNDIDCMKLMYEDNIVLGDIQTTVPEQLG